MPSSLLVFDSHPVQYRVPIWQKMELQVPGSVHVVYASDCSVRGHADSGFGQTFAWDEPMLSGYANTILNCEKGVPLSSWSSLTGKGVKEIIEKLKPSAILLTGLNYRYDWVAYFHARKRGIPVWLRCETQDESVTRSKSKAVIRSVLYRSAYICLSRIFFIGELNKSHYLKHGVPKEKLVEAHYATTDRFANLSVLEKNSKRAVQREKCDILPEQFVVGFSGKFINKKNPDILFDMLSSLPEALRKKTYLYFLGSGTLEEKLKNLAAEASKKYGVNSFFAGFVNQTELPPHYLAMDVLVLPSLRMGETWGLVANEAMQAGCGVIVSDAVGCGADFKDWERFSIFKEKDAEQLANCIKVQSQFQRNFHWAEELLTDYSIEKIAQTFIKELATLK